jgi:hypothetical protein
MRYPDGGGLTAEQRRRREEVRMRAVGLFEEGAKVPCIARELRVSENRLASIAAAVLTLERHPSKGSTLVVTGPNRGEPLISRG